MSRQPTAPVQAYIGDGCYASYDGFQVWLWTSDGIRETNRIALEPQTYVALLRFTEQFWNIPNPMPKMDND